MLSERRGIALMRALILPLALVIALAGTPVQAGDGLVSLPKRDRFSVEPFAGTAVTAGGTFVKEFSEVLAQAGTVGGITSRPRSASMSPTVTFPM